MILLWYLLVNKTENGPAARNVTGIDGKEVVGDPNADILSR